MAETAALATLDVVHLLSVEVVGEGETIRAR